METTTRMISHLMARPATAGRTSDSPKSAIDVWLSANIKAVDDAEYQRYRSYLVLEECLVDAGVVGANDQASRMRAQ